jgi:hypothetical protein
MSYTSKSGRRPDEYASKSAHSQIIRDPSVQAFLRQCRLPARSEEVKLAEQHSVAYKPVAHNPIRHIIAVDGGYDHITIREGFPSATICFFQLGALTFSVADLESLSQQPFIDPEDIARLKQIQRMKFVMPIRNVALQGQGTLTDSVRFAVYRFFQQRMADGCLMESLRWLIFQEFDNPKSEWHLSSCPLCDSRQIPLRRDEMTNRYTFVCEDCQGKIYLTDVLRLHERIDDELGAGEILAYTITSIEQFILVHLIRLILNLKPGLLEEILFIKDGPLAFFGPTLNIQRPMRALIQYLFENYNLYLTGLEKSGSFVEHADEIADELEKGTALIVDNDYICHYVLPGVGELSRPYGSSTY